MDNEKPKHQPNDPNALEIFYQRRKFLISRMIMYGILIFFGFLSILPFFWLISTSLMTPGEAQAAKVLPANPQWQNYIDAWDEANFDEYFINSSVIAIISILGTLIMCVLAGYAFARIRFVGRDIMFTLLLSTLMVPETVVMIPNFLTVNAQIFPLPNPTETPPFIHFVGTWMDSLQGLTLPFMASAFSIFLLRQFFAQIPDELWEAAKLDGSGHLRFLIQICLPIARPAVTTVTLLTFIGSWNSFLWPLLITRSDEWRPIVLGLYYFQGDGGTELQLMMAASFITIVPLLILYFFTQRTFTEGLATTGLKG